MNPEQQTHALLDLIEADRARHCAQILGDANGRAAALRACRHLSKGRSARVGGDTRNTAAHPLRSRCVAPILYGMKAPHTTAARPSAPTLTPLMPEREAAALLGMSIYFLRTARRLGRGPAFARFGTSVRYRLSDLERWIADRMVATAGRSSRARLDTHGVDG